jgi:hypothetical protein
VPTRGKYQYLLTSPPSERPQSLLCRNITKSSQSNGKNASRANKSGSNDSQANSSPGRSVPAPRASAKIRTTSVNGVAVARSGNVNPKSKKPSKKSRVVEISDQEDDDSLEREAALASPAKGAESRKATVTKVSKIIYMFLYVF